MTFLSSTDRFALHRASPEIGIDEYERSLVLDLGGWVMGRSRIYLDKCFWIHLRNARLGLKSPPGAWELLAALIEGVASGRLLCPISDALFLELMKQSDLTTRRATSELIDELSCGVTLCAQPTRVATEVAHFLHTGAGHEVYPLERLVWTKVPFALGIQHPVASALSDAEQLVIQKAFLDHLWELPLSSMDETIGGTWPSDNVQSDLADRLNHENAAHAPFMKSFAQVCRDEINGALELAAPIAADVMQSMAEKALGPNGRPTLEQREETIGACLALLRAAVRKPVGQQALRTLYVGALLHAALRWNRSQKVNSNDLFDFQHAGAALGYCDALLTDGPMHALLAQRHLGIERNFSCTVLSSIEEATNWIERRLA